MLQLSCLQEVDVDWSTSKVPCPARLSLLGAQFRLLRCDEEAGATGASEVVSLALVVAQPQWASLDGFPLPKSHTPYALSLPELLRNS